ncbi:MAG TPA: LysR substrate-binding domain-containing protein, partial [Alphaproteobacteria bacterium]|nr:LysR substrate-binding domain-containing protein [Alphaproteobacteria bacterium]
QLRALAEDGLDIGFVRLPVGEGAGDLSFETVLREPLVLAVRRDHPLAGQATVSLAALAEETILLYPRPIGTGFYDQVVALCRAAGFSPRIAERSRQLSTMVSLVSAGLGVALVPESLRRVSVEGVVYRRLAGETPTAALALARRRGGDAPVAANFVGIVRSVAGRLRNGDDHSNESMDIPS